jgi:hypothetical protein
MFILIHVLVALCVVEFEKVAIARYLNKMNTKFIATTFDDELSMFDRAVPLLCTQKSLKVDDLKSGRTKNVQGFLDELCAKVHAHPFVRTSIFICESHVACFLWLR